MCWSTNLHISASCFACDAAWHKYSIKSKDIDFSFIIRIRGNRTCTELLLSSTYAMNTKNSSRNALLSLCSMMMVCTVHWSWMTKWIQMHVTGRCEQLLRGKQGVSHLRLSSRECVNYADVNSFIVISPVLDDVSKWTVDQVENLPHGYFGEKKN